jgi:hypothetical protein
MPIDRTIPALTLQQPWVELILSGRKTLEVRSIGTRRRGRVLLYSSRRVSTHPVARPMVADLSDTPLPLGRVVGSVEIIGCRAAVRGDAPGACVAWEHLNGLFVWELAGPLRWEEPLAADRVPYGVWFYPWGRE